MNKKWEFFKHGDNIVTDNNLIVAMYEEDMTEHNMLDNAKLGIWEQSSGEDIDITDMTTNHINNAIRMMESKLPTYTTFTANIASIYITKMKKEIERRVQGYMSTEKIKGVVLSVVGVKFANEDGTNRQSNIQKMTQNTPIALDPEPTNQYDSNAIKVMAFIDDKWAQIGYIGKEYAAIIADMMKNNRSFSATIKETGFYKETYYCKIIIDEQ